MATVIRSWRIEDDKLVEMPELPAGKQGLLEDRLEGWLAAQPDAIRDNLLIIGRQVSTASGPLDLLGITADGLLVIVELKRDRAPREVVAQAIDYASWIADQAMEDIEAIASKYLDKELGAAFRARFGEPLPEIDPANVSVIVVASRLDEPTERMIQFLSRQYGMDIDGLLFRYLKLPGDEILIRTSVIPEERPVGRGDRDRATPDALVRMASERGVSSILASLRKLGEFLTETPGKIYGGSFRYWAPGRMLCGVNTAGYWAPKPGALDVWVTYSHWAQAYGLDESVVLDRLKSFTVVTQYPGSHQLVLRIASDEDAQRFVALLRGWAGADSSGQHNEWSCKFRDDGRIGVAAEWPGSCRPGENLIARLTAGCEPAVRRFGRVAVVVAVSVAAIYFAAADVVLLKSWSSMAAHSDEAAMRELRPVVATLPAGSLLVSPATRGVRESNPRLTYLDLIDYSSPRGNGPASVDAVLDDVARAQAAGRRVYYMHSRVEATGDTFARAGLATSPTSRTLSVDSA